MKNTMSQREIARYHNLLLEDYKLDEISSHLHVTIECLEKCSPEAFARVKKDKKTQAELDMATPSKKAIEAARIAAEAAENARIVAAREAELTAQKQRDAVTKAEEEAIAKVQAEEKAKKKTSEFEEQKAKDAEILAKAAVQTKAKQQKS